MTEKILVSWSGGKDSTLALYELRQTPQYEVAALLTTVTDSYDRISMHGVRRALLERQAASLGLPLQKIFISPGATNASYETSLSAALAVYQQQGIHAIAFGDLFLADIKRYREEYLARIDMTGLFPVWQRNTTEMAQKFIQLGFKAVTVCVDPRALDASFVGRIIDADFLQQLPSHVDPCGENGEFHSFVYDGPLFREAIPFTVGEVVLRDSFCFCDLLPAV
jgi:uncharacterized protein (TIGR00290 family)